MSSQRTAHDFEQDVLRGMRLEEAREEAARLEAKAQAITDHLARIHYLDSSVVRQNLEHERNALEMEAADWQARIAEFTGQVEKVRGPGPVPTLRALLAWRRRAAV